MDNSLVGCEGDIQDELSKGGSSSSGMSFYCIFLLHHTDILVCEAYPGKLHLCVDDWTSPQVITFLGATVH
jgi:hypothetical protein